MVVGCPRVVFPVALVAGHVFSERVLPGELLAKMKPLINNKVNFEGSNESGCMFNSPFLPAAAALISQLHR